MLVLGVAKAQFVQNFFRPKRNSFLDDRAIIMKSRN